MSPTAIPFMTQGFGESGLIREEIDSLKPVTYNEQATA